MSSVPSTRRGRASRERIVARAAELIAERGVHAARVEDVLAAAGASKSQLYHYFADRDELIEAAVAERCGQVLGELRAAFAEVATLAEFEQTLAGFGAAAGERLAGCPIGTLASEVAETNEAARRQVATAFAGWEELLARAIERMRERGELRADADPAALATAVLASIEGGLLLSQTRRDAASLRIALAAAVAHLRTFAQHRLD